MLRLPRAQSIWNFLIISTAAIGFLILAILLTPHQAVKGLVDSLAPDGSMESFTPAFFSSFKRIFLPLGLVSLLIAIWLVRNRHGASQILSRILISQQEFSSARSIEIRQLAATLSLIFSDSRYGIALFALTIIGIWNRAVLLTRQVSHDEAYTFMAFVSMGLRQVMTDYHLPNNHVFHSILVFFSSGVFGIQPWAIRMPAFFAGVLLIPSTYIVGRIFYDKQTALISAGWVAAIPALIGYAASARGYSIIALFTLILLALGAYLKENRNLVGWVIFVLISALGFYTIPIMLYPFGLVMAWIFLSAVFKHVGRDYGEPSFYKFVIKTLIPVGIAVSFLVILFYSPIFIESGVQSVVGNGFVQSMEWWEFKESIPVRINNTWREWNSGLPEVLTALMITGLVISALTALTKKPRRVPLGAAALLWIGSALVIQRVAPWPRVWLFLLPLFLIWSANGLLGIARILGSRLTKTKSFVNMVFLVCLFIPLLMSSGNSWNEFKLSKGEKGNIEELAIFLIDAMGPQDVILVTAPDAVTLRYYLKQYGIEGNQVFFRDDEKYRNAYAIVNERYEQTLDTVMDNRSSTSEIDTYNARIVYERGRITVYEINMLRNSGD